MTATTDQTTTDITTGTQIPTDSRRQRTPRRVALPVTACAATVVAVAVAAPIPAVVAAVSYNHNETILDLRIEH